tara:strand:- start:50 stop:712 length:663 start_codon:yes stop_codon:yes gene_type:complete
MSEIKLTADSGGGSVSLKGPASTTSNAAVPFVLPVADGSAGQYLKTDGSKNLGWASDTAGGITHIDEWRITSSFTGGASPIANNWERADHNGVALLGTGMSESSGIFTFPVTGMWRIDVIYSWDLTDDDTTYMWPTIKYSSNSGTDYHNLASVISNFSRHTATGAKIYDSGTGATNLDVTDASTFRLKVHMAIQAGKSPTTRGSTDVTDTGFIFTRLADT